MKRVYFISIVLTFYFNVNLGQIPTFTNPVLRGGYPDPSICRVGNDYYMANSSFEYFPAIPIHHSTDLVQWELIGHGLNRLEQCGERSKPYGCTIRWRNTCPNIKVPQQYFLSNYHKRIPTS